MDKTLVVVEPGGRLDQFLARHFSDVSRGYCQDLIARGLVRVGGVNRGCDYRLATGDVVVVRWPECAWKDLPLEDWVLFEDPAIVVFNKPSGLLMHPVGESWLHRPEAAATDREPNLAGLLYWRRPKVLKSGVERCGLVHRLDRGTSGVLVVAKTPQSQDFLNDAFNRRLVEKAYRAVVLGRMEKSVDVEAPVGRKTGGRSIRVTPWGREAATAVRALGTAENASLVEACPRTGRTHQIRAHLMHIGHPVLGDPESRTADPADLQKQDLPAPPRMMLHAYRLEFPHPRTRRLVRFTAPLPRDFKEYWKRLES